MSDNSISNIQNTKLNKTKSLNRLQQPKREKFIFDDVVRESLKKSNSESLLSLASNDHLNIHMSLPELKEFTYLPNNYELEYKLTSSEIKSLYQQTCYNIIQVSFNIHPTI